jgi:hypothetical protein
MAKDKKRQYALHKQWRKDNPDRWKRIQRKHAIKRYGLTIEEYEQLADEQMKRCAVCNHKPDEWDLCVDHDHVTGAVRGLLCARCNMGIGQFRDNPTFLHSAADYLSRNKKD